MSKRFRSLRSTILMFVVALAFAVVFTLLQTKSTKVGAEQLVDNNPYSSPSDRAETGRDSLFAEINRGFVALEPILVKACFDCHTDRTRFPWYHNLPVIKGFLDGHIRDAKKHLNMSDGFPFSKDGNVADDLVAIHDELKEGAMPPLSYRLLHWDAKPSKTDADSIYHWINVSLKALSAHGIEPTNPPAEEEK